MLGCQVQHRLYKLQKKWKLTFVTSHKSTPYKRLSWSIHQRRLLKTVARGKLQEIQMMKERESKTELPQEGCGVVCWLLTPNPGAFSHSSYSLIPHLFFHSLSTRTSRYAVASAWALPISSLRFLRFSKDITWLLAQGVGPGWGKCPPSSQSDKYSLSVPQSLTGDHFPPPCLTWQLFWQVFGF